MIGTPASKNSDPNLIWEQNFDLIKSNITDDITKYLNDELYNFYVEEVGIEKIITYLEEQDKQEDMSFNTTLDFGQFTLLNSKTNYTKIDLQEDDDDDEISINRNIEYNIPMIKMNLLKYFLNELVEDIPVNSILRNREDVKDFIKMYEIKFLHEFLIPIADSKIKKSKN